LKQSPHQTFLHGGKLPLGIKKFEQNSPTPLFLRIPQARHFPIHERKFSWFIMGVVPDLETLVEDVFCPYSGFSSLNQPRTLVSVNMMQRQNDENNKWLMHSLRPKFWTTRNSKYQVSILRQVFSPQVGHQPRQHKHMGEVGSREPIVIEDF
jgi:hypothetical protein